MGVKEIESCSFDFYILEIIENCSKTVDKKVPSPP